MIAQIAALRALGFAYSERAKSAEALRLGLTAVLEQHALVHLNAADMLEEQDREQLGIPRAVETVGEAAARDAAAYTKIPGEDL